jgi:Predicted membrane protein involved in D-alanine export
MLFSSSSFLFIFLPLSVLFYYTCAKKHKNLLFLIISLLFYCWSEVKLVIPLLGVTVINYICGLLITKGYRKLGLYFSLILSIGNLFAFKYLNFTFDNIVSLCQLFGVDFDIKIPQIVLPLGISFYTFQALSYTVDVYRKEVEATKNIVNFATYMMMFPPLIAGPIIRYADIAKQLVQRTETINNCSQGLSRFIIGLSKKMLIANVCGEIADDVFMYPIEHISSGTAWLGIAAYSFQIFFDFSAYSDMAIGLGKMFGFSILENFNYPYISKSVQEFWRRWHISLSSWFRDYLYIPLGGNRKGSMRTYINLFIVFFITGFWHGANWNFVVWGLFHGTFLVVERLGFNNVLSKIWTPIAHIYTLLVVVIGWVFFRSDNLTIAVNYIQKMFAFDFSSERALLISSLLTVEMLITFVVAILFCFPIHSYMKKVIAKQKIAMFTRVSYYLFLLVLLFVSMIYIVAGNYNPFIYFRF